MKTLMVFLPVILGTPISQQCNVEIQRSLSSEQSEFLNSKVLDFVCKLQVLFNDRRLELLKKRDELQNAIDNGFKLGFRKETESVRNDDSWHCVEPANGLVDRRVEITGPVDRKLIINALNSGATQFMADLEGKMNYCVSTKDSTSPTWENMIQGQINLKDAVYGTIDFVSPSGQKYSLAKDVPLATLLVRPRGWHMEEKHVLVNGIPMSASLFDFGVYFYHNAMKLIENGVGPYFYLPKIESHLEARLWNDVFVFAQKELGLPIGTIRATVLIETITAAFEMDEILFELKDHSSGLNCGRWDYIFSLIKKMRNDPLFLLPDRSKVTMTSPFMDAYVRLLIKTCHRRGVHAMGGMAAQIPIKNDPIANEEALEKVLNDKKREVGAGHDGTWVAHPALVPIAKEVFNEAMPQANQLSLQRSDVVTEDDLLNVSIPDGSVTEKGIRENIVVALKYMASWLNGVGCAPINNLMEDAATAEISRSQLWQWLKHKVRIDDGRVVDWELLEHLINDESSKLGDAKYDLAKTLFSESVKAEEFVEFLTNLCYDHLIKEKN